MRRIDLIKGKWMENGSIRFFFDRGGQSNGCSELFNAPIYGIAYTITVGQCGNVLKYYDL